MTVTCPACSLEVEGELGSEFLTCPACGAEFPPSPEDEEPTTMGPTHDGAPEDDPEIEEHTEGVTSADADPSVDEEEQTVGGEDPPSVPVASAHSGEEHTLPEPEKDGVSLETESRSGEEDDPLATAGYVAAGDAGRAASTDPSETGRPSIGVHRGSRTTLTHAEDNVWAGAKPRPTQTMGSPRPRRARPPTPPPPPTPPTPPPREAAPFMDAEDDEATSMVRPPADAPVDPRLAGVSNEQEREEATRQVRTMTFGSDEVGAAAQAMSSAAEESFEASREAEQEEAQAPAQPAIQRIPDEPPAPRRATARFGLGDDGAPGSRLSEPTEATNTDRPAMSGGTRVDGEPIPPGETETYAPPEPPPAAPAPPQTPQEPEEDAPQDRALSQTLWAAPPQPPPIPSAASAAQPPAEEQPPPPAVPPPLPPEAVPQPEVPPAPQQASASAETDWWSPASEDRETLDQAGDGEDGASFEDLSDVAVVDQAQVPQEPTATGLPESTGTGLESSAYPSLEFEGLDHQDTGAIRTQTGEDDDPVGELSEQLAPPTTADDDFGASMDLSDAFAAAPEVSEEMSAPSFDAAEVSEELPAAPEVSEEISAVGPQSGGSDSVQLDDLDPFGDFGSASGVESGLGITGEQALMDEESEPDDSADAVGGLEDVDFEAFLAQQSSEVNIPTIDEAASRKMEAAAEPLPQPGTGTIEFHDLGEDEGAAAQPEDPSGEVFFVSAPSISELEPEEQELLEAIRLTGAENAAAEPSAVLELDVAPGEQAPLPTGAAVTEAAPEAGEAPAPRVAAPIALPKRRPRTTGLLLAGVGLGVLLVVGVGYALMQLGVLPFGGGSANVGNGVKTGTQRATKISKSALAQDTPAAYKREIRRLEKLETQFPEDAQIKEQIAALYARFRERFPVDFQKDPVLNKKWGKIHKKVGSPNTKALIDAMELMAKGEEETALKQLQEYLATSAQDPQVLYMLGKIHYQRGNYDEADRLFRKLVQANRNDVRANYFLGRVLAAAEKYDAAEKYFLQVSKLNPDHLDGRLELARVYLERGKYDKAREQATAVIESARQKKVLSARFEAHRLLARVFAALNEPQKQIEHLRFALKVRQTEELLLDLAELHRRQSEYTRMGEVLRECPEVGCESERYHSLYVDSLIASSRFPKAEKAVNEALKKYPDSTPLHLLKGELAERLEQFKNAKSEYEAVIKLSPAEAVAYVRLSDVEVKEKNLEAAEKVLISGLDKVGNKVPLLKKLITLYELKKQPVQRRDVLRQLVELEPGNPDYRLRLAMAYKSLANYEEALQQFIELQRTARVSEEAAMEYVDTLLRVGKLEAARTEAIRYYRDHPTSVAAALMLGEIELGLKNYEKAAEYLQEALKLDPRGARTHFLLGRVRNAEEKLPAAIDHFRKAVTLEEDNSDYRYTLAEVLLATKDRKLQQEAKTHLDFLIVQSEEKRIELSSDRLAEIYDARGNIYMRNGNLSKAFGDFSRALSLDTEKISNLANYGKSLYRIKKYKEAERYLSEVVRKDPFHSEANLHLGKIALKNKNRSKAEQYFKRTVKLGGKQFPMAYKFLGDLYWEKGLTDLAKSNYEKYIEFSPTRPYDADEIERKLRRR